ncbi:glycosyltransferase family 4 protein [Halocola ammonii]
MKDSPRILHVSTPKSWRGGEQQLAYLFEQLQGKGIHQHIICASGSEMEQKCKTEKWSFSAVPVKSSLDFSFAKKLRNLCLEQKVDIVHTHDSKGHTFAVLAATFYRNQASIVVSRRVDFPVSGSPLSKWKYNHKKVTRIVCVSDTIKKITGQSIRDKSKLVTVHSGVNMARFEEVKDTRPLEKEFNLDPNKPIIGNVAALAPHKDYPTFIATAQELVRLGVDAQFVIVGDGPLHNQIHQLVKESGIADKITFTGFRKDVLEVLSNFDIFLITSETEGLGTSILDAFGCKVPVVATRAGGIPEIVIHTKTGLSASVKDSQSLAVEVVRYLRDETLRKQMVRNASEHLQEFTVEATAQKTLKVYSEVLTESRL